MNSLFKVFLICTLIIGWGVTTLQAQKGDVITNEYPKEKEEILQTWDDIVESVKEGNVDKLIFFSCLRTQVY